MVSMSKPQGVSQAQGYLAKENYYQKNSEIGKFFGNGLEYIGLEKGTEVTPEMYNHLLRGFDPVSGKALHPNSGKEYRRAGMDVTFSAPKSVSILMENYEATGANYKADLLRNAHDLAVRNAMKKLENTYAKTRVYGEDKKQYKVDANLIYATFQHDTSREVAGNIDPQLHSHNFIFTSVFYNDPKTGEVRNLALSNEEIYQNKMYLGQLYRSELGSNMAELGYKIEVTDRKNGFFELEGLTRDQIEKFSSRENLILDKLPEYREKYPKMKEAELLQLIKSDTKNAKKEIDRDAVREQNLERMEAVGINKSLINSMENRGKKEPTNEELMRDHIDKSLDNLMQKQSLFTREDLSKMVLKYGLEHGYKEKDYLPFITNNSEVIQLDKNVYSTQKMIDAEKNIIKSIHKTRDKFDYFAEYESDKVRLFLEKNYPTMTDEQVQMTRFILGNKDQFVAIQGDAGTGKTFAARAVKEYLETYHDNQEIIGLSFTGKATQGLENDTDIKSSTVHSFLAKEAKLEGNNESKDRLIIVDEAGMIGSLQMNELVENAKKKGDRLVFMGDTKQFKSISAGNIFNDMQKWGTKTVKLSQALRQKSDLAKEAVTSLKEQMVKKSLSIIEEKGTFKEYSRDESVKEIASNYASLKTKKQNDTLIITSTNKDKEAINWAIRSALGKGGAVYKVQSNASVDGIAAHYSQGYEVGQKIAITGTLKGFSNKEKLVITAIKDDKTITVKSTGKKSQEKEINVYTHGDKLQVFREVEKPFAKGDVIIFTKNTVLNKKRVSVKNGERTRIKSINKHGDVVTTEGKKFNITKMPYVDHGYAITDVKSQGTTVKNVVVMAKSDMANFNSFYTQITRAKKNITLYTDNKEQLAANVQKTENTKTTLDYTIKKREKPSLEKEQPLVKKGKSTYKDIHVSRTKETDKPLAVTKGTRNNLKKVGVHQTNMDSMAKIDIYRNSIGKLEGMEKEKSTTPHEKFKGIEVAIKKEEEQNYGRDNTREDFQQTTGDRGEVRESRESETRGDTKRSTTDQSRDDRSGQNNGSRPGLFGKVKRGFKKLLKTEISKHDEKSSLTAKEPVKQVELQSNKNKPGNDNSKSSRSREKNTIQNKGGKEKNKVAHLKAATYTKLSKVGVYQSNLESMAKIDIYRKSRGTLDGVSDKNIIKHRKFNNIQITKKGKENEFNIRRRKAASLRTIGTLQSNLANTERVALYRQKTRLCGLSVSGMVRHQNDPKVLLQTHVHDNMGRERAAANNGVRWQGDIHSDGNGSRAGRRTGISHADKLKEFMAAKKGTSVSQEKKEVTQGRPTGEKKPLSNADKLKSFMKNKKAPVKEIDQGLER